MAPGDVAVPIAPDPMTTRRRVAVELVGQPQRGDEQLAAVRAAQEHVVFGRIWCEQGQVQAGLGRQRREPGPASRLSSDHTARCR